VMSRYVKSEHRVPIQNKSETVIKFGTVKLPTLQASLSSPPKITEPPTFSKVELETVNVLPPSPASCVILPLMYSIPSRLTCI
jgi:hypothetical protein